ncbi:MULTISPECIES: FecR domain-containing protein [Pseudomonas]|uniref:DUF4880 domain-containing protein n=1 Tax=Pseudomonas aphyarum TaxID=2942629 RepID=A0ABT5PH77_9PSED|nr:FecR domain-containing protein [Pseudomonas aphyarum]MDD0967859.1 DUF4880 domain-containing protein [Pseudomonas aphyarum]MDD1123170.1 DUF4880 domain-containing protein [Pseudomonas aphyarum]
MSTVPAPSLQEPSLSLQLCEEAMEWWLDLHDANADASAHTALTVWRNQDPLHEVAWQRAVVLGGQLEALRRQGQPRLARQALLLPASNGLSRRGAIKGLALLLASGASAWAARDSGLVSRVGADFATGVNERQQQVLSRDLSLQLNTRSALDARLTDQQWQLDLLEGEALIDSTFKTTALTLQTAQLQARASNARFTVRRLDNDSTLLAVYRGTLQVTPRTSGTVTVLQSGNLARFSARALLDQGVLNASAAAWTEGMIVADGQPLGIFLDELARYRRGHLGCDPALANLRVWGTYPLADSDRVIDAVAQTLKLDVQRFTRLWVNLRPPPNTV